MTASMRNNRSGRRRRRRKLALFAGVLCGVLLLGTAALAYLALRRSAALSERGGTYRADGTARESEDASETENEREGGLLSGVMSETAEAETEAPESGGDAALDGEWAREDKTYALGTESGERIVLAFAGDILFDPQYAVMARLQQRGGAIEEAFSEELLSRMRGADLFMVNNEFPYSDRGEPTEGKQFTFRAKPESVSYLKEMGVDLVSLANNHASDYGETSLLDTLDTLEEAGIPYVGAGRNLEEAKRPARFLMNGKWITILSATQIERSDHPDTPGAGEETPGTFRCWNPETLLEEIRAARTDSDVVIVYIHWGTENEAQIDWAQREQAELIAQAGADLIVGDHPHCLQPIGYVDGVPVLYSLGNFLFNSKTLDTCLAEVTIPEEGELTVRILPARQSDCRTELLVGEEARGVLSYLNGISETGVLDETGTLSPRS